MVFWGEGCELVEKKIQEKSKNCVEVAEMFSLIIAFSVNLQFLYPRNFVAITVFSVLARSICFRNLCDGSEIQL